MNKFFILLSALCSLIFGFPGSANAKEFQRVNFGGISVELPKTWKYTDPKIYEHLNTAGEAASKLIGVEPNPGKNIILVAAKTSLDGRSISASLRLSVRFGPSPTQEQTRQIGTLSSAEISELLSKAVDAQGDMSESGMIRSAGPQEVRFVQNDSIACLYSQRQLTLESGEVLVTGTYSCPLGDRVVKLSTMHRPEAAALFEPVLKYVWKSLRVDGSGRR